MNVHPGDLEEALAAQPQERPKPKPAKVKPKSQLKFPTTSPFETSMDRSFTTWRDL